MPSNLACLCSCAPAGSTPSSPMTAPATSPTPDPPTPTPTATLTPTPTPTSLPPAGYTAYRVKPRDTLETISELGGSTPDFLLHYNFLTEPPQIGRELIVPQLPGRTSTLPEELLIVTKGNTVKPWVALTIDCGGENPNTRTILDTLKAANVRITFFILGSSIINDRALLQRIAADGHEIANHSYTHADFTTLTEAEIIDDLRDADAVIRDIVGPEVRIYPYFRFPYGAYNRDTLRTVIGQGYLPIHWTLDSLDSVGELKSPEFIADQITNGLPAEEMPGAIILTHCTGRTAAALPLVLKTFAERGIEVRTLTDVLGR